MRQIKWLYLLPVFTLFISDYLFEIFESQQEYEDIVLNYKPSFAQNFYYFTKTISDFICFSVLLCLIKLNYRNLYFTFIYGAVIFYLAKGTLNEIITLIGYDLPALNNYYSGVEHWTIFVLFVGYILFVIYHREKWKWENLKSDTYNPMNVMVAARKPLRLIEYLGSFFNLTPAGSYVILYSGYKVGFSAQTHKLQDLPFILNEKYILKDTGVEPEIFIKEMKEKSLSGKRFNIFTNNCMSWNFCNIAKLFRVK